MTIQVSRSEFKKLQNYFYQNPGAETCNLIVSVPYSSDENEDEWCGECLTDEDCICSPKKMTEEEKLRKEAEDFLNSL